MYSQFEQVSMELEDFSEFEISRVPISVLLQKVKEQSKTGQCRMMQRESFRGCGNSHEEQIKMKLDRHHLANNSKFSLGGPMEVGGI